MWRSTLLVCATLAVACGGGGGDGGEMEPAVPEVSLDRLDIHVERRADWPNGVTESIGISFVNLPDSGIYAATSEPPPMLRGISASARSQTRGDLYFEFVPPTEIGPGEHTAELLFAFCLDADCEQLLNGFPVTIALSYTVIAPVESPYPEAEQLPEPLSELPLELLGVFPHDVQDVQYAVAADSLSIIANAPTPSWWLYDQQMSELAQLEMMGNLTQQSVSPDGRLVTVLEDDTVALIELFSGSGQLSPRVVRRRSLADVELIYSLAMDDAGVVYASVVDSNGIASLERLDMRTGQRLSVQTRPYLEQVSLDARYDRLILMAQDRIGSNAWWLFDVSGGQPELIEQADSGLPYACGTAYPIGATQRLLAQCGTVLRYDTAATQLTYDGTLRNPSLRAPQLDAGWWVGLAQAASGEPLIALQADEPACRAPDAAGCETRVSVFSSEHVALIQDFTIPSRTVDGVQRAQSGIAVFQAAVSQPALLVTRLQEEANGVGAYALSRFTLGSLTEAPPFEPDDGPYNEPRYDTAVPPIEALSQQFIPHNILDVVVSRELGVILATASYPNNALHVYQLDSLEHIEVALPQFPMSLALAPAGNEAVIGHDARITRISLEALLSGEESSVTVLRTPTQASHVVVDDNGRVHVLPKATHFPALTVDRSGGVALAASGITPAGMAWLDSAQQVIYAAEPPFTMVKLDVSGERLNYVDRYLRSDGDFQSTHRLAEEQRLVGAGGGVYQLTPDPETDMAELQRLDLDREDSQNYSVVDLSQLDSEGDVVALTQRRSDCRGAISVLSKCFSRIAVYAGGTLERQAAHTVNPYVIDGKPFTQVPLSVVHANVPDELIMFSRLHGNRPPAEKFLLTRLRTPAPIESPSP